MKTTKKLLIFVVCILSLTAYSIAFSQEKKKEEVTAAEANKTLQSLQKSVDMNPVSPACETNDESTTTIDCSCDKETKTKTTVLEYESKKDLPPFIRKLPDLQRIEDHDHITIALTEINDNLNASPVASLLGIATHRRLDGNDFARTHGMDLMVALKKKNSITYTLRGTTELYTKSIKTQDSKDDPIHFTEDDILSLTRDNKAQNKTFFYSTTAGMQMFNSEKLITGGAAKQQNTFHKLAKPEQQHQLTYVPDGTSIKIGPFTDLAVGMNHTFANGGICRLRLQGEAGTHLSTIAGTSRFSTELHATGILDNKKSKLELDVGARAIAHAQGVQVDQIIQLAYRRKNWGVNSAVEIPSGHLVNNSLKYNTDFEPIARVSIYTFIRYKTKPKPAASTTPAPGSL